MPIPSPNANESKNDFISRCMSSDKMQSEYPSQDQRLAVCHTSWRGKSKMKSHNAIIGTLKKIEKQLGDYVQKIAVQEKEMLFMSEIPLTDLIQYSKTGQLLYKSIYIKNRVAGNSIKKSLDVANSFVGRDDKQNKMMILKQIESDLKNMVRKREEESFYQDSNEEDALIEKAEPKEGDTKMVFGNPMKYSGGKWVPTSGGKEDEGEEMESGDISSIDDQRILETVFGDEDSYADAIDSITNNIKNNPDEFAKFNNDEEEIYNYFDDLNENEFMLEYKKYAPEHYQEIKDILEEMESGDIEDDEDLSFESWDDAYEFYINEPDDAIEDIIESSSSDDLQDWKEDLDLDEDASDDEIKDAIREEMSGWSNKELAETASDLAISQEEVESGENMNFDNIGDVTKYTQQLKQKQEQDHKERFGPSGSERKELMNKTDDELIQIYSEMENVKPNEVDEMKKFNHEGMVNTIIGNKIGLESTALAQKQRKIIEDFYNKS